MKKGILFFLLLSLGASSVNGQAYKPMLKQVNEWQITTCFGGCLKDIYFTDGDTIANGKTYSILDGYHYISRSFLLREDIPNRKVYFLFYDPFSPSKEVLLYDFSVNAGDTIPMTNVISPFPNDPGDFVCDSIVPTLMEDSTYSNKYYFTPVDTAQAAAKQAIWIEGVGSLSLINAPGGEPDFNGVGQLSCFFQNEESIYADFSNNEECTPIRTINGISQAPLEKHSICYFNHDGIIISSSSQISRISIFDGIGRMIYSNESLPRLQNHRIPLIGIKNQIVFVRVETMEGLLEMHKVYVPTH